MAWGESPRIASSLRRARQCLLETPPRVHQINSMKYSGIIFDFNGVILWDSEWHDEAWRKTSKELIGREFSDEEMHNLVHGRTNKDIFTFLLKREIAGEELEMLTQKKETNYRSIAISKPNFKLSPGTVELFDFLKANRIIFTIATSSEKTNVDFFFKNLPLENWFDINKIVYDNGKLPGKPAPDIYLKAAEIIKLPPGMCIVVEDAVSGIRLAHNAGIGKIIALGSEGKNKKFEQVNDFINRIITRLDQITIVDFEN